MTDFSLWVMLSAVVDIYTLLKTGHMNTQTHTGTHNYVCAHTPLTLLILKRRQQVDLGRQIEMDSDPKRDR